MGMLSDSDGNGIMIVDVKAEDLLAALRTNREKHAVEYIEAEKGYREKCVTELEKLVVKAKEAGPGANVDTSVHLARPKSHTKDYDRAIRMLEMCTNKELKITDSQFAQYVLDDWAWKSEFVGTNSAYMGRGR